MTPEPDISEREARVVHMLSRAMLTERAPVSLRVGIEDLRRRTGRREPSAAWSVVSLPVRLTTAAATSLTGIAVVVALILTGGAAGPSIAAAAALAARGATGPAPALDPHAPAAFLAAHVGDLRFPNWEHHGGWRSSGERTDRLGNRRVTTIYYARNGQQLAYSIVSQPELTGLEAYDEPYQTMHQHGRTVVVWTEDRHTCVLSAVGISARKLWQLATSTFSH